MKKENVKTVWIVTVFAIAMGFLEAAVVVYLRDLFYPAGFKFPILGFINPSILGMEWLREFATIVMLVTIGCLAAKKLYVRFAYFLYAFAIWDIFYYIFLKLALNWPSSFFTWDLLFLIPWPWIGPIIAPIVCSLFFIIIACLIINFEDRGKVKRFSKMEWAGFIAATVLFLYSWLYDYGVLIFKNGFAKSFFTLQTNPKFIEMVSNYAPARYNWVLFSIAVIITILSINSFYARNSRK